MTENKMTVRFYKKTAAQLAYLEKLWETKPMLIEKMPSTRNAFINMTGICGHRDPCAA